MGHPWHSLSPDDTLQRLASSRQGLGSSEAGRRLADQGPNRLTGRKRVHPAMVFLRQFLSPSSTC